MNDKQKLFCEEYLVDLNATKSAVRAGYSAKNAAQRGCALLKMPEISAHINKLMKKRQRRLEISSVKIVEELAKIAFSNIDGLSSADKGELDSNKKGGSSSVKVSEKLRALELLGKHFGIFKEKMVEEEDECVNPFSELSTEELKRLVENGG